MSQQYRIGTHKTSVYKDDEGFTRVKYHQTDVVKFNDKVIELNTGGWFTVTTKLRLNQASAQFGLGYSVYQKKGEWFVKYFDGVHKFGDENNSDVHILTR